MVYQVSQQLDSLMGDSGRVDCDFDNFCRCVPICSSSGGELSMDGNPMEESCTESIRGGACSEVPRFLYFEVEEAAGDLSLKRLSSNVLVLGLDCDSLLAWRECVRGVPGLDEEASQAGT